MAQGRSNGRMPYGRIRRIRLGFPADDDAELSLSRRDLARGRAEAQIASTSWKSLVEHERLDARLSGLRHRAVPPHRRGRRADDLSGRIAGR